MTRTEFEEKSFEDVMSQLNEELDEITTLDRLKEFAKFSCNEWKEYSSMRLLFIGTSQQKLKMKISKEIEEGNMEYKPVTTYQDWDGERIIWKEKENTPKQQAKLFREDWETESRDSIRSELKYGDFDYTYNNEEI